MNNPRVLKVATEIVSAFVVNNKIPGNAVPDLIGSVYASLQSSKEVPVSTMEKRTPAVPVGKSITPDYVICLEDGRKFKSMRHHLKRLGMTPEQYRTKWGLSFDYPVVAPSFAAKRSELAKAQRFGRWRADKNSKAKDGKSAVSLR
jgi:predicted transcriptional regulator